MSVLPDTAKSLETGSGKRDGSAVGWTSRQLLIFREIGFAVLVTGAVLLISAMALQGANLTALRATYTRVQNSNIALLEMSSLHTHALMMEMMYRGYLLTGDANFLARGAFGRRGEENSFRKLSGLFEGDAEQTKNLARLHSAMSEFEAKLRTLVAMPHDKAVAAVIALAHTNSRGPVVRILAAMQDEEGKRLAARVEAANRRMREAMLLSFAIIAASVIAGALGLILIFHGRRARKPA